MLPDLFNSSVIIVGGAPKVSNSIMRFSTFIISLLCFNIVHWNGNFGFFWQSFGIIHTNDQTSNDFDNIAFLKSQMNRFQFILDSPYLFNQFLQQMNQCC